MDIMPNVTNLKFLPKFQIYFQNELNFKLFF